MYLAGAYGGSLMLQQCGLLSYFESVDKGGFFFVENPLIVLTKNGGTNWNHLNST